MVAGFGGLLEVVMIVGHCLMERENRIVDYIILLFNRVIYIILMSCM